MTIEDLVQIIGVPGPTVPEREIQDVERHLDTPLPAAYRRFLLTCNGGLLDARFGAFGVYPDHLYGLRSDDERFSLWAAVRRQTECMASGMLPIGDEHSGAILCIQLRGPESGTFWSWHAGTTRRVANSFDAFLDALEEAVHRSPGVVLYDDGMLHYENNRLCEALDCFQRSWELEEHAGTAHRIGQTLQALNRRAESYAWFARAYERNPRNSKMATAHAGALHEQGQDAEARRVLRSVLSSAPTYGPAKQLLASLTKPCST